MNNIKGHRRGHVVALLGSIAAGLGSFGAAPAIAQEAASLPEDDGAIVVTARRREESLLEVPIAISVVSGDQLQRDGITRAEDIQFLVPGLSVVSFLGGANPSLRGVGTGQNVSGTDESVGIYLDEIYQGIGSAAFSRMFDVERVEVLKGPQGTLYGRNVTAGAISVVSRAPVMGEFGGEADISYGTYQTVRANAAVNVPLGEKAALRVSGTFGNSQGFVKNIDTGDYLNGEDYFGLRARLLMEPIEDITVDIGVQYVKDDTPFVWEAMDDSPFFIGYGRSITPEGFFFSTDETLNVNLRATARLTDTLSLRWISGYFWQDGLTGQGGPPETRDPLNAGFVQVDDTNYEQFSQEVQLQWENDRSSAVVGAYYLDAVSRSQRPTSANIFGIPVYQNALFTDTTTAFALFGEAQIGLTDKLSVVAGLRYNDERRGLSGRAGDPPGLIDPAEPFFGSRSFSATSGRLGLNYQATDDTFLFATVSKGFKSGGVQSLPDGTVGSFDPETLWSYELGAKHALPKGGALEASLFQYDYDDLQVLQVINIADFQVVNAAKARVRGAELNARLRAGENFGFNFAGTYLDAKYREFIFRALGGVDTDLAGFRLARAPEVSLSTQLIFDRWAVGSLWEGSARAELNYRSSQYTTVGSPAEMEAASLDELLLLNFVVDLAPVNDKGFGLFLSARNLTDQRYYEFRGDGGLLGGTIARGRTFDIGVRARF
jgi:iron complex outermembrane receptor protein